MKSILIFITLAFTLSTYAQKDGVTVTVIVENVPNDSGKVMLGLYDENTFMKAAPIVSANEKTTNKTATFTITNVQAGAYGITCFHDENNNDQMDFEASGMPKESYGVSNNNMSFGPPQWEAAKFEVTGEDLKLTIRM